MEDDHQEFDTARDRVIIAACRASMEIMLRRGLTIEDVANGFISFGGAIALEIVGLEATAGIFQSKADGLGEKLQ